jgi:hypothetical protein
VTEHFWMRKSMNLPPFMVANRSNAKNWSREGTRNAMLEARFKKALIPYKRLEKALKGWNAR